MPNTPPPPGLRIGHVHLRVSDLDRSIGFYRDVIGLELVRRLGTGAAFLSAGGYHHHIGLNTWDSAGAPPPPPGPAGLVHAAGLFPPRMGVSFTGIVRAMLGRWRPTGGSIS